MKRFQEVLILVILVISPIADALQKSYYANICPNVETIVRGAVEAKMALSPKTAPSILRLFFHDCFVRGCDASVMIRNSNGNDERHHRDDLTLNKEAFDTVSWAKKIVDADLRCTNKVSCADILALAARDSVYLSGGPFWSVELGRYDGKISTKKGVVLPHPDQNLDKLTKLFATFGLNQTDLIALSGGHTFGVARCSFFSNRLYPKTDPTMDPIFASVLKAMCPRILDNLSGAFLDPTTVGKFDNAYYKNLQKGKGLLASDQILYNDPRSRDMVNLFASNQTIFFRAFTESMMKLGRIGVKNSSDGEIRRDCQFSN